MAIDLIKYPCDGFYLTARLCEEAGVCLHDDLGNRVEIHEATYERGQGLRVTDEEGRTFRLKVFAKRVT